MFRHRLYEVDILRGLTFLAIVMQHTLAIFIYQPGLSAATSITSAFLLVLIRYAVPMFIFITGLVLFYNHSGPTFNYGQFIKKRFSQIFIPYFAWTIIYYLWSGQSAHRGLNQALFDVGRLTISGDACYHLWFMVAIMQFYLLFPFFRWFVIKLRKKAALTLSLCLLLYIGLMWFNTYSAPQLYEQVQSPWLKTLLAYRDRLFISWFFYFILGGYAGLWGRKLKIILTAAQKTNLYVFLVSFAIVLYAVVNTGKTNTAGVYQMNYLFTLPLTPAMVIYLVSSLVTFYYLSLTHFMKNRLITNTLKTFGRYSYGCYFVHAMVLYYLTIFKDLYLTGVDPLAQLLLMFTACSAVSLIICYLISKIRVPVGNTLVGKISA